MIWQNPWAWLGLLTLALPILIHLLSRRSARVQNFPSLRFLQALQLLPARRARLTEPLLLIVRCAILAAAAAGLAQPLFLTADRERELGRTLARAIVVDTSTSMRRASPAGASALVSARTQARSAQGEATAALVVETDAPARALPGAAAWLGTQEGRREVVIISDFQEGTLSERDVSTLPAQLGVRLQRIEVTADSATLTITQRQREQQSTAHIRLAAERTDVEWTVRRAALPADKVELALLAGAGENERADAARRAALAVGTSLETDSLRPIAIVYPGYGSRSALLRAAQPLNQPWMADLVARLRRDSVFGAASGSAAALADTARSANLIVLARNDQGAPLALAARGLIGEKHGLVLFALVDAGSLASAALIAAVGRAATIAPQASELDPSSVPAETLERWQRPAAPNVPVRRHTGASDGRWFWVLALLFIGAETWLRRTRRTALPATAEEVPRERVA